jgi:hypothetical protein
VGVLKKQTGCENKKNKQTFRVTKHPQYEKKRRIGKK